MADSLDAFNRLVFGVGQTRIASSQVVRKSGADPRD